MRVRNGDKADAMRTGFFLLADLIAAMCHEIEIGAVARQFEAFRHELAGGKYPEPDRLADRIDFLVKALERELIEQWFHRVSADKKPYYGADFGEAVKSSFASSRHDIVEANTCFALGRYHATVYHCMMALEPGLRALAKRLGEKPSPKKGTWGDIFRDIRAAINRRRAALAQPPKGTPQITPSAASRERQLLDAAGEAALEFRFFENAWRNHVAHARADYDEGDAKKVLDHTKAFMEMLATKLKLKG